MNKKISVILYVVFSCVTSLLGISLLSEVQAGSQGILVSPHRVVLEGRNRSARITLVNPNPQARYFKIGLIHMAMDEKGQMVRIKEPTSEQRAVEKMLRFSPRRTMLKAGESQVIRLMARRPAGVSDGEYRVRLSLTPLPLPPDEDANDTVSSSTSLDINLLIGVSLPVFIRFGDLAAEVSVSRLTMASVSPPVAEVELSRTGNRSVAVDMDLFISPDMDSDGEKAGRVSGAAVYYPNPVRSVKVPLSLPEGVNLSGRYMKVVLKDHEQKGSPVLFSKTFSIGVQ